MTIERVRMALEECCREIGVPPLGYALEMSLARAALGAISEPTDEMIEVGMSFGLNDELVWDVWCAMHSAMMKETVK